MVIMKQERTKKNNIQCEDVFKFLNPNGNDLISKMNESDLKEFTTLLNKYYLVLRKKLNFSDDISFGLEIEFEHADRYQIDHELFMKMRGSGYTTVADTSLTEGAEINTPILYNKADTWIKIDEVCKIIDKWANIGSNSGGHVHVGAQILGNSTNNWLNFMKLWSVYEYIIYRFTNGEYLTSRPSMEEYACPIARCMWHDAKKIEKAEYEVPQLIAYLNSLYSNNAVDFSHVKKYNCHELRNGNTIEFRCPNGTINPIIWQNNVNLFVNMLLYAKNSNFDIDRLVKRHEISLERYFSTQMFNKIYLDVALEFCDMIFDNNLDKMYFLRQYLKSFQISKSDNYRKAKIMTLR